MVLRTTLIIHVERIVDQELTEEAEIAWREDVINRIEYLLKDSKEVITEPIRDFEGTISIWPEGSEYDDQSVLDPDYQGDIPIG